MGFSSKAPPDLRLISSGFVPDGQSIFQSHLSRFLSDIMVRLSEYGADARLLPGLIQPASCNDDQREDNGKPQHCQNGGFILLDIFLFKIVLCS